MFHPVQSVASVTIFKSCENSGCADVLLTPRAANKEVQHDALVKSQQVRVDAAMVREWDKWNEFGVTKFLSKKQLNDIMKRKPRPENRGNQMGLHGEDHPGQARVQGSTGRSRVSRGTRATSGQVRPLDRETPSS